MVFEALNRLGAEAESAVYIGDSDVDIQTAKNAGVPCISVLWGFRNREFLIEHGAQRFIEKPSEIIGV
jgi:phosphoglycolate phosphatase